MAGIGVPVLVGDIAVHALPYLEPATCSGPLETDQRTHSGVLRAAMERVRADVAARRGRSVVMAHAFVTGGATSDSERDISVGGVSAVHPDVFSGVDYVALGHLHGAQRVSDPVRYSGSPVAMSFSEHAHTKGFWLVDLDATSVRTTFVDAPVERPLRLLRGTLDQLLDDPGLRGAQTAYCQVTLTDAVRPLGAMDRLKRRFPHTLVLQFDPQGAVTPLSSYAARLASSQGEFDTCCDFLAHVRGGHGASLEEQSLLREALDASRVERARRADELGAMLPGLDELELPEAGVA